MAISTTYSCEPTGLDWEKLYTDYDINSDQMIDIREWTKLIELRGQSVSWQKQFFSLDHKRIKIFKSLDQNNNGLIDQQEITNIYRYFINPCQNK